MAAINFLLVVALLFVALAHSAPTEPEAGAASTTAATSSQTTTATAPTTTTVAPVSSSTSAQTTTTAAVPSTSQPSSAPAAGAKNATGPSPVHSDQPKLDATSFTCYGRSIGYYADVDLGCKVYHFCMLGDYNGEPVYQRISYRCLNSTIFDQKTLDCVEEMATHCSESPNYYETSNAVLKQSIIQ